MDRMVGVGALSREETIAYAITGPLLRAVGVRYDVRRAQPYDVYDRLEFEIPTQEGRRQLRALPRAHGRDGAVHAHRRAGARADPGWADQRRLRGAADRPRDVRGPRKQGKTEGLLLVPLTLSPNLQGQQRAALDRVNVPDKRVVLPSKETT